MKRRLKKFKNHIDTGGEYRKPYYKKRLLWKEKKSEIGFPFEYEFDELCNQAIPQIRRRDKEVKYIKVDSVFDVFFLGDGRIVTL